MFGGKKINKEDLAELRKRVELINEYNLVSQALEVQKGLYLNKILPKYGCDLSKNYNIDLKTGKIGEAKSNPSQLPR